MLLSVQLGSIRFPNPVFVASGTFGYIKEMASLIDVSRLGGVIPKTITVSPRPGNKPPRTVETTAGLLNAIGLDNDGLDEFLNHKIPYLKNLKCPVIVSVAAKKPEECRILGETLSACDGITAIELNVSCPNVSGGVDYGTDPILCEKLVSEFRKWSRIPFSVKLSPNVTNIAEIARAAEAGGADMISAINTCYGLSVDWRRRKSRIGNGYAGFSGPAVKPIALRCVHQIYKAVKLPIIGIGGIASVDDVMEFMVAGASAVQIGTANFYRPDITIQIIDQLPHVMEQEGINDLSEIIGTLQL